MSALVDHRRHADRVGLARWMVASVTASVAVALAVAGLAAARGQLTPEVGMLAGVSVAVLSMLGLPSVSIRLVARTTLLVSAVVLVRFGVSGGSFAGSGQLILVWIVAATAALVLCDRIGSEMADPMGGERAPSSPSRPVPTLRVIAVVGAAVLLVAVVLAPVLLPHVGQATEAGQGATLDPLAGGADPLRAASTLDMTTRPALTDEVVFTVDTDRATFWRGQTYDRWDGRTWSRSDDRFTTLRGPGLVRTAPDDLGAGGDDVVEQRIRIEAPFAEVVYAAPSPVRIDIDRPVRQRADGTIVSAPMGQGATYTVESRREPLSAERLRAVDGQPIPEAVVEQYAAAPTTTERVREVATEITAEAPTQYDAVLAIEAWMGDRVEYSLDAPLAPTGVDVVDHFLFEAEQGWPNFFQLAEICRIEYMAFYPRQIISQL